MIEDFRLKVRFYDLDIVDEENRWFGKRVGQPKAAVCPNCGEISVYLEDLEKIKNSRQ